MSGVNQLLPLILGLCFVSAFVHSEAMKLYGGGLFNANEDMMPKYAQQKEQQARLEKQLKNVQKPEERAEILKELEKGKEAIANMESSYKLVYKDHLEEIAALTRKYTSEKERLQKEIEKNELEIKKRSLQALQDSNHRSVQEIANFEERLNALQKGLKMITDPLEAYAEVIKRQNDEIKEEKEQLLMEGEEIAKQKEEAQNRA